MRDVRLLRPILKDNISNKERIQRYNNFRLEYEAQKAQEISLNPTVSDNDLKTQKIQPYIESMQANTVEQVKKMWESVAITNTDLSSGQIVTPLIEIIIHNQSILALFDTGAGTCVMSNKTAKQLDLQISPTKQVVNSCVLTALEVVGQATITIEFGNKQGTQTFIIVEKLDHPIILGIDLIINWGIIPILHSGEYCFSDNQDIHHKFIGGHNKLIPNVEVSTLETNTTPPIYSKRVIEIFTQICYKDPSLETLPPNEPVKTSTIIDLEQNMMPRAENIIQESNSHTPTV